MPGISKGISACYSSSASYNTYGGITTLTTAAVDETTWAKVFAKAAASETKEANEYYKTITSLSDELSKGR